jgi:MMP 1-O-methyltransferase
MPHTLPRHARPWRLGTKARLLLRGLRYTSILSYASIDGWLTVDEAVTLFELARSTPHEAPRCVEIGSWQGKSTICLAAGLRGKRQPVLTCIDPFDASGDAQSADDYDARARDLGGPLRRAFEQNLEAAHLRELVEIRQGTSHEHAAEFSPSIDLLFVDGDHGYEAVRQDYFDWAGKVRPGGFLVMHDVVHPVHEGPRRVVEEFVQKDPQWVDGRYVDSMFVARKLMV